jgi:hypothetical protein
MDIGDIIRILGILFFVVIPVVRSIIRRVQPQQPPVPPTGQTKPVGNLVTTVPSTTTPNTGQFEKRLEQARQKVQEAMNTKNTGGLLKPENTRDIGQESAEGMFRSGKPALPKDMRGAPIPSDLHGSTLPSDFQQKARTVGNFIPEQSHKGATNIKSLQKTPQASPKHAKLNTRILLSKDMLSEQELTRGLLWQQILSEPRSKQKRRTLSQHR